MWNDLLVALLHIGRRTPIINPLAIVAAAAFITMAVPLAMFFALQRHFVRPIVGVGVIG